MMGVDEKMNSLGRFLPQDSVPSTASISTRGVLSLKVVQRLAIGGSRQRQP